MQNCNKCELLCQLSEKCFIFCIVGDNNSSFFICFISLVRATKQCIKRRCVPFSRANEHKPAWQTQKQSLTNTKQTTRCVPIFSIFKPSLFVYGLLYNSLMFFYLRKLLFSGFLQRYFCTWLIKLEISNWASLYKFFVINDMDFITKIHVRKSLKIRQTIWCSPTLMILTFFISRLLLWAIFSMCLASSSIASLLSFSMF